MRNIVSVLLLVPIIVNVAFYKDCFAKPPTAKTLLWEISGNGLGQPSYIFGTIHEGCAKQLALSLEQGAALARTRQLYTETSYASIKSVDKSLKEKKQRLLKDLIKPTQYKIIEDFFGKSYLDFEQSQKGDPKDLIASLQIAIRKEATYKFFGRRCTEITSKERVLIAAANRHGIRLDGIETNNDRSNVLQDTSLQAIVDQLISMIDEYLTTPDSVDEKLAESQRSYIEQDIYAMSTSGDAANDILQKPLVEERNRLWISRMQNAMKQNPTFFAFGAAHLGGNTGVIALLESKGYRLRPIFDKPVVNPLAAQPQSSQRVLKASDYFDIGKKKEEEREYLEAIDNYSQAIILNPQYVEAYKRRADLRLNNINDTQGAMKDLNQAIAITPKDTNLYYSRARLKQGKLKDFKSALADLNKIIEINPQASTAYFNRGMLKKQRLNDLQSALLDFNNHLLLEPQSVDGYVERGLLKYIQLADKNGGIADLRRAIYLARINAVKSSSYESQQEVDKIQTILQTMGDKL